MKGKKDIEKKLEELKQNQEVYSEVNARAGDIETNTYIEGQIDILKWALDDE